MNKYFSFNVLGDRADWNVQTHQTLEEAKKSCSDNAEEHYDLLLSLGELDEYTIHDFENAIYGKVMGKVEITQRKPTQDEKEEFGPNIEFIMEYPRIVDYQQNNGWIKCSEQLPEIERMLGFFDCSKNILALGQEDEYDQPNIFVAYMIEGNRFYSSNGECFSVTHWQPLPEYPIN